MADFKLFTIIWIVVIAIMAVSQLGSCQSQDDGFDNIHFESPKEFVPIPLKLTKRATTAGATCGTICNKLNKRLICGSDGVTYDNPCHFRECGKKINKNVRINHEGAC